MVYRKYIYLLLSLFVFIYLIYALFYELGYEYSQATADLWINRSYRFFLAFKSNDFEDTYVFYHPGVTISWLVGAVTYYFPKYLRWKYGYVLDPLNPQVFPEFNFLSLVPIVLSIFLTILISYFLLKKFLDKWASLIFVFLLSTEPFFISNTRSIHMDAFVTMFVFLSYLTLIVYFFAERWRYSYLILSSCFFALS